MPDPIRLADYRPPAYAVDTVELEFELDPERTVVRNRMVLHRQADGDLVLYGSRLELLALRVDGVALTADGYRVDGETMAIPGIPDRTVIEVESAIAPRANSALEGLYLSSGMYCTQCEAEGFRRITWYPDRPDVMGRFTTTVIADETSCPVLLSNGDRVAAGRRDDGRHWVRWVDPYPKPSYLFALVAGDLACVHERFTTAGGRDVALEMYVQHHNADKCDHALAALAKAMRWDEARFGREYDLDTYMVVAVDDFNMGAMENKGLNVFNSSCVLASPATATDGDYHRIESIVAHEYFHNWTGNRVTCRDWFQLSLKEGLTVFRDQLFSAETFSAAVQRINDVNVLRTHQFAEDAGPMAHPVRPDQYIEINNFYTLTVYNKGAEVVRMLHTVLGDAGFRRGLDLYFERHDGQAVTVEDLVAALGDANATDLGRYLAWYRQAGTPRLTVDEAWDPTRGEYRLTLRQQTPATPGQQDKAPLPIPVALALLDHDGSPLPAQLAGETTAGVTGTRVVELAEAETRLTFTGLATRPVPSLLQGFSAPVRLDFPGMEAHLGHLAAHDRDPFNRWDALQRQAVGVLWETIDALREERDPELPATLHDVFGKTLADEDLDPALVALALTLPNETYLAELSAVPDPVLIHRASRWLRGALAEALSAPLWHTYRRLDDGTPYAFEPVAAGRRALKNLCLGYLMERPDEAVRTACVAQFESADNMTDVLAALGALADADVPERRPTLDRFRARWLDDAQVIDKWFSVQARSRLPGTLDRVRALMDDPLFSPRNPNKVRAVVGAFCAGNPAQFHAADGSGYAFLGEQVRRLDGSNPQLASRLLGAFGSWRRLDADRQRLVEAELATILRLPKLSRDQFEVASKLLAAPATKHESDRAVG